jgi:mono/diheme cytochrome c family protein
MWRVDARIRIAALCLIVGLPAVAPLSSADGPDATIERQFGDTIRPFLTTYCLGCHGTAAPAAQFDMRPYSTIGAVIADLGHWRQMSERLRAGQMPPANRPQPSPAQRAQVLDWIDAVVMREARAHAGDPGPVLPRRLSNAEYDNTIRDLTGVDIRPAREFPVDPANTEGFDNSGESLSMSPALFTKYLQAARQVSEHLVLKPDGIAFAPHPMLADTDRDRYAIARILEFYAHQPTDYADYFAAAWRYKHRATLGRGRAALAAVAAEAKVSATYLARVWDILETPTTPGVPEVGPVATLQSMWRALPAPRRNGIDQPGPKTIEMRDFVRRIRLHTSMQFAAPRVQGLPPGSQPLLNWKLRQFNLHRREFDPRALRHDTDAEPTIPPPPRYPGLHQEAAPRWAALLARARAGDTDLVVPAAERARYHASFARFASVFPDAFYVSERGRYFPDDSDDKGRFLSAGYHNVMGFWRDDVPLMELVLDDRGRQELDRLWDEFDFIADHTARTWAQFYFNQSGAVDGKDAEAGRPRPTDKAIDHPDVIFGLRDDYRAKAAADPGNDPDAVQAMEHHFTWVNVTLRRVQQMRRDAEPSHLQGVLRFAARAYRRPLSSNERDELMAYYRRLREQDGLAHEDAVRDLVVSVLMSPRFCYRLDLIDADATRGAASVRNAGQPPSYEPLSGYALASRLSYFLWASMPDDELLGVAGRLHRKDVLLAQTRRMLKDPRVRGLAREFGGQWLDFRRFEQHNAVDRERFPGFTNALREAMFEEPVRLIEDVVRNDRSILDLIYGRDTFVNLSLATHYGMPAPAGDDTRWVHVADASPYGRGGLFTMAVFLTQHAHGLRTSPVKRGYWMVRRVLGETIPPPPPSVPELPKDESTMDRPMREVLAAHRTNPTCAACHARFDTFGLAFENYGPVGERREHDLAGRRTDVDAKLPGGVQASGASGVRDYIRQRRQDDYLGTVSRKLWTYALNRSPILPDDVLLQRMRAQLPVNGYRFSSLVETIVTSSAFLNRRRDGAETTRTKAE